VWGPKQRIELPSLEKTGTVPSALDDRPLSPLSRFPQATFYGMSGAAGAGACVLKPAFYAVGATVAINAAQWDGGAVCGKCVRITRMEAGITTPIKGPLFATIDNLCPECKFGDIDMGLGGDGRWRINWDFVPCGRRSLRGAEITWPQEAFLEEGQDQDGAQDSSGEQH
jgi:hypothetical protein